MFTLTTYSQSKSNERSTTCRNDDASMRSVLIQGNYYLRNSAFQGLKFIVSFKELEKNGFIEIVYTEEKNGIVQKFYQSVARGFTPAADLLPHLEMRSESGRQIFLQCQKERKP